MMLTTPAFGDPISNPSQTGRRGGKGTALVFCLALLSFPAHAAFSDHVHVISPPLTAPPLVFEDADHGQHAVADYKGRFVLLNVWATWCGPCVKEMPSLEALQQAMGTRLVILPLSEDRGDAVVSAFYQRHALTHLPIAVDTAGIAPSALQMRGLPTTFLINPKGMEIARFEGDIAWNAPEVLVFLAEAMK